jgi:hypothetical protein
MNAMPEQRALPLIHNWETTRFELLNTRICDLGLRIEGSPVDPLVRRVRRELERKGFRYEPRFYLTDSWGCPDRVPAIGIPFYLADRRVRRIEEEQTGEVEDDPTVLMFLRHEVGHAVNYAYRLWRDPEWARIFGPFTRPYRDRFRPNPFSRDFVRHLRSMSHGWNYAQKHPDEDFSETFAVWLTPRSGWRRKYRHWPALRKLRYVDARMRAIRRLRPPRTGGQRVRPVEGIRMKLAQHYGQRAERYRAVAQGYVDDRLREVFPPTRARTTQPAAVMIRRHREDIGALLVRWAELQAEEIDGILTKLEDRAAALRLESGRRETHRRLVALGALAASLAMDLTYAGRFMG